MQQRGHGWLGAWTLLGGAVVVAAAIGACGGAPAAKSPSGGASSVAAATGGPADQLAQGAKSYSDNCSSCHGDGGEGDPPSPALIGSGALAEDPPKDSELRKTKFVTAQDVFDFTMKSMPKDGEGTVNANDMWAITAWTLHQNGISWGDAPLGPTNAKGVKLRK